ncbi:unnamed protein product [Caenorhabditis bovis]|uniref:MBOAT family protein n=1 Tax=Caenorhabditis bovis TaxID=2654633 RepID=A0A8S1F1S6_9PELO|nr:unnamed protein product [Caenorhabditis bovis]
MKASIAGPLPRVERVLAWLVWCTHSAAAFLIAIAVCNGRLHTWIQHWLRESSYHPNFKMDLSDMEWAYYRGTICHLVFDYSLNSIGLYLIRKYLKPPYSYYAIIAFGFILQIHMGSLKCVGVLYAFAALVTILTNFCRHYAICWIICISFIVKAYQYAPFSLGNAIYYREFNIYLYGAIKIISANLFLCSNPKLGFKDVWLQTLLYYAYLPYSITLIVTFSDFKSQFQLWEVSSGIARKFAKAALRLIFWFFVFEAMLHFIYVNAIFNSPISIINSLNIYEACSVAYIVGQFFHLKYVVIFGVPAFFAFLDGMRPPPPPICISRVSLYSRMWRYFDNGLYQFLKHHVYIPVMSKPLPRFLSVLRGLMAIAAVFSVVLAWHGTKRHYLFWVSLSAFELITERIGSMIWRTEFVQNVRKNIGENWCRRIIATLMLLTVTPGIFGVFFFLGQEGVGESIFKNAVIQGFLDVINFNITIKPLSTGFGFLHILTLGYFFNNVCLDLEYFKLNKKD